MRGRGAGDGVEGAEGRPGLKLCRLSAEERLQRQQAACGGESPPKYLKPKALRVHPTIGLHPTGSNKSMSPSIALVQGLGAVKVGDMLALSGLSSERPVKRLSPPADELVRSIVLVLDELTACALDKRTAAEFTSFRNEAFPKYFDATRSLSDLARIVIPLHVIHILNNESFSEMEADLREHGSTAFGTAVRDQALFTVWTLRKISDICQKINESAKLTGNDLKADQDFSLQFAFYAVWTRFHFDCLAKSLRIKKPIYPEVLEVIIGGLRSAVDAYAWARRGLELRFPIVEQDLAPVEWDEEEQALLAESTYDMLAEPI